MRKTAPAVLAVLMLAGAASAQPPHGAVLPDRIRTGLGEEFVPRFATFKSSRLVVPPGKTVQIAGDVEYDTIEVAGTLRCSGPLTLRVDEILTLPGSLFDCQQPFVITFRDTPLDLVRDPFQFGKGLIAFGRVVLRGPRTVTPFAALTGEVEAGATSLPLTVPANWEVGDELLVPDTRQMKFSGDGSPAIPPRREARVFIAAKTATSITLSKALDFEHRAVRDPDGAVKLWPRVANLTRGSSLVSEVAANVTRRGHVILVGHEAAWDIQGVGLVDLGRTTVEPLDSTTMDANGAVTHVGTNQIGRYAFHAHHGHGFGSVFRGNVLVNSGSAKWAHVTHGTHDSLIEHNVSVGHVGGGFITEDGYEVRNVYRGNFAAYHKGNGRKATENLGPRIGAEGAGFWFHGMHQIHDRNEAWNNNIGVNFFYFAQVPGKIPSAPGGNDFVAFDARNAMPISSAFNVYGANFENGLETWASPFKLLATDTVIAHTGAQNVGTGSGAPGSIWLKNVYIYGEPSLKIRNIGVSTGHGYLRHARIDGGEILGQHFGIRDTIQSLELRNVRMQNIVNIEHNFAAAVNVFDRVIHQPLPGFPAKYLTVRPQPDWKPGDPYPMNYVPNWLPPFANLGARYRVVNWQGSGQDYLLYSPGSIASRPALPAVTRDYPTWCPEAGLTTAQCFARYGLTYGGGIVGDADVVTLDGISGLVAKAGFVEPPLGPPRTVLTYPNRVMPAVVSDGRTMLHFALTGARDVASDVGVYQIDNGPILKSRNNHGNPHDDFVRQIPTDAVADGEHTVRTWREDGNGKILRGTEMTFTYFVGRVPVVASAASESRR